MKRSKKIFGLAVLLLSAAVTLSACTGGASPTPISSPEPTGASSEGDGGESEAAEATAVESAADAGLCTNPYYPVAEGVEHSYLGSETTLGSYSFSTTVTDVRDDGFTLITEFDGVTVTQEWACLPEGLQAITYAGGPAGSVSLEGSQAQYETSSVSGISLPLSVSPGDTWAQSMTVTGRQSFEGLEGGTVEGEITFNYVAVGLESIDTAAGSFEAMRVDVTTDFNFTVTVSDFATPVEFSSRSTSWFAEGIGWVKSEGQSESFGIVSETSIDMTGYTIP